MEAYQQQVWVEGIRTGDSKVFDQVYSFYRPRVFSFLARLSGRRDLAEDLLQETFLRLARHGPDLHPETRLGPWLFTVARNLFVSAWRRFRYEADPIPGWGQECAVTDWISPFDLAAATETERLLEQGLTSLPPAFREVLLLLVVERLTPEEAAQVIGISPEALRQRLSRARAMLKDSLDRLEKGKESKP